MWRGAAAALAAVALAGPARADLRPWQIDMQPPATEQAHLLQNFHHILLVITTLITLLVMGLLIYVIVRFNAKRNPVPSRTAHNTVVEIVWTAVPILILIGIAIPSFNILYFLDRTDQADMTLKIIGRQWYWSYEYPDNGNFVFDSTLVPEGDLKPEQPRLLTVDNPVVLPVGANIRLLMTASDVIHSWTVPSFGVKKDSVPGRINETWVRIDRPGIFYGQCSELCGVGHAYMPIEVHAVPKEEFDAWVQQAQQRFAKADEPGPQLASAAPIR